MYPKRKPEDESVTKLKKLGLEPANKRCFDCGQRGPTYINVTIGSFVCSTCGGLLRGIAPPQRIKSVSMATFTATEVQLVEQRGNEVCKSIWLGKWDKPDPPTFDKTSETGRRDFLCDKYEKKLWYVDPSQAAVKKEAPEGKSLKQIAEKQTPSPIAVPRSRGSSVASIKTPPLLKASPGSGMVRSTSLPLNTQQPAAARQTASQPSPGQLRPPQQQRPPATQQQSAPSVQPTVNQTPPQLPPRAKVADLLSGGGDDPFKSSQQVSSSQNFANFDAFGLSSGSNTAPTPTPQFAVSGAVLQPQNPNQPRTSPPKPAAPVKAEGESDRYAALADLDNTLRSLSFTSSTAETNPFAQASSAEPPQQYPTSTFASQPMSQAPATSNPFVQGNWGNANGFQQTYGQGGVSMVNNSSILSTGMQQGTPSQVPFGNFPAANSVGTLDNQYQMYGQNQVSGQNQFAQSAQFAPQFTQQQFAQQQQQQLLAQQQMFAAQMATQPGMQTNMFAMQSQSHNPFMMATASQQPTNPFT